MPKAEGFLGQEGTEKNHEMLLSEKDTQREKSKYEGRKGFGFTDVNFNVSV